MIKKSYFEKMHRQRVLKEYNAVQLIEKYFCLMVIFLSTLEKTKSNNPTLVKTTTKNDEIKELKYENGNVLKSFKIDKECYKLKNCEIKKVFITISEILVGVTG